MPLKKKTPNLQLYGAMRTLLIAYPDLRLAETQVELNAIGIHFALYTVAHYRRQVKAELKEEQSASSVG